MEQPELTALLEKTDLEAEDRTRVSALVLEAQRLARELQDDNVNVLQKLDEERRQGVERYRAALLAANPELPGDFVTGASYEEVDQRLAALKAVQQSTEKRLAQAMERHVDPAAGGQRGDPNAGLSGEARIAAGLASRRS